MPGKKKEQLLNVYEVYEALFSRGMLDAQLALGSRHSKPMVLAHVDVMTCQSMSNLRINEKAIVPLL